MNTELFAPFSIVVSSLTILGILFEHVVWRCRLLHGWFVKRPDIRGTWRSIIESDWTSEDNQDSRKTIEGYMGITQTLSKLQMHLMTAESESWLTAQDIHESPTGSGYEVVGVFTNRPDALLRGATSEMHFGTIVLTTHGQLVRKPSEMRGEYWTDRKTKGTMRLTWIANTVYTTFDSISKVESHWAT